MSFPSSPQTACRVASYSVIVVVLLFIATQVEAQIIVDNIVDDSLDRYETRFNLFAGNVRGLVLNTFYLLAVIEISWSVISVFIRNAGLQVLVSTLVTRIMFIGFFAFLLARGTATVPEGALTAIEIKDSFMDLAIATGVVDDTISPSNVMDLGQELWSRMYGLATDVNVFDIVFSDDISLSTPVVLLFAGILAFVIMAILAAHFAVVLLEAFFAASGGIILLGLGASRWTYKYAVSYLKYAMSVGIKLFFFTIIVGITIDEVDRFTTNVDLYRFTNIAALIAFLLFALIVSLIVPKSVKGVMDAVDAG